MDDVLPPLAALLPDIDLTTRQPGRTRRLLGRATGGHAPGVDVFVVDPTAGLPGFTISLPDASDLLPERIAAAARTTVAVRRRFGAALGHLRRISFDFSNRAMRHGAVAGSASHNTSTVHLSAAYVTASGVAEEERRLGRPVISMAGLVAHELWHLIELAWEVRDYAATVTFRRELGRYFGAETIEHVVRGDAALRARLEAEVTAYATTTAKEATAEMFEGWWTFGAATPVLAHFGALIDRYFPA